MNESFKQEDYSVYFEQDFRHRWLRPYLLSEKLRRFESEQDLTITLAGQSLLDRDIRTVEWGEGDIKLLCWTQMHGNEPTATMAVIDLLNFLVADDQYNELRGLLKSRLKLCIIPMLNPDGAEVFTRRNVLNVDPNRDALAQQTPEIRFLLNLVDDFKPDWCFNLHDQRNIFAAGDTDRCATISFLAPSADIDRALTPTRERCMQLIGRMTKAVEQLLPQNIGRYSDEFYPRALGEYFHRLNIPSVLVESGAYLKDPYRDVARKLNFLALLEGFQSIAAEKLEEKDMETYHEIPQNHSHMLDLILRDCEVMNKGQIIRIDIGLLFEEKPNFDTQELERYYLLQDMGDLRYQYGIEEEWGGTLITDYRSLELGKRANFRTHREDQEPIILENGILK